MIMLSIMQALKLVTTHQPHAMYMYNYHIFRRKSEIDRDFKMLVFVAVFESTKTYLKMWAIYVLFEEITLIVISKLILWA